MATVELYSVQAGELKEFELSVDHNGEIVAECGTEALKFPGNVTKKELQKLFTDHNKANDGVVALTPEEIKEQEGRLDKAQGLVDSL